MQSIGVKLSILCLCVIGYIFLPTTVFLAFGMMPTMAAFLTDRSVGRNKTVCVGLMNFAGCFPFLLKFWTDFGQQTVPNAFRLASDLETIIVVYLLAAGGYAIDIAVTGITSNIVIKRSQKRLKKARIEQEKLVKRWGQKVTGKYALDDYGFPTEPIAGDDRHQKESVDDVVKSDDDLT
jgi:hypothetical protein